MIKIIKNIIFYCSVFLLFGVNSLEAGSISPELETLISAQRGSHASVDVIIEFKEKLSFSPQIKIKRNEIVKRLIIKNINSRKQLISLLKLNNITAKNLWLNNSVAATIPIRLIPLIASLNKVSVVRLDRKIILETSVQGSTPITLDWNITTIGADTVWEQGTTGEGVVIGSMDTGVDINHPDLSASWLGGNHSWFDPYGAHIAPYDSNGHGTQTTSLITGGSASGQAIGVAPGAKWIAAKIFDDTDTASISAIHQAFQWMLDPDGNPDTNDGANIINNSWNFGTISGQCDYEFQDDISILRSADIAVVFSAGNSGPSPETSHSPANNEDTIPVGAIDETQNITFFSSRGPSACDDGVIYPKLTAPGVNVLTADLTFGGIFPNSYTYSTGTSYAGPHVSGALALLQSKYPSSSLSVRETALYTTATIKKSVNDYGSGIIDIDAAIKYMGTARLISPIGQINENIVPTFIWNKVFNSTHYKLYVSNAFTGDQLINQVYTTTDAGCTASAICSLTPTTSLPAGSYRWWIRILNATGWEPWSKPMSFSLGSIPMAATLNTPSGSNANSTPSYNWNAVASSTHYKLYVSNAFTGDQLINQVYTTADTDCATNATCSLTPTVTLPNGSYRWWIRALNATGWGPWSTPTSFSLGSAPMAVALNTPSDSIANSTPTYNWNAASGSTQYKLYVSNTTGTQLINQTYTAADAGCATGTNCSLTPAVTLPNGSYRWWIRTLNSSGWGPWSIPIKFVKN